MNNEQVLEHLTSKITAPDQEVAAETSAHVDSLTKPPGSLGKLEEPGDPPSRHDWQCTSAF